MEDVVANIKCYGEAFQHYFCAYGGAEIRTAHVFLRKPPSGTNRVRFRDHVLVPFVA